MTDHASQHHDMFPGLEVDKPEPLSSAERGQRLTQELVTFVEAEGFARTARTRARYRHVLTQLLRYLDEADLSRHLGTIDLDLLEEERRAGSEGSFLRLLGLDELVCCLPGFLEHPWLPYAPGQRRTHVSLVDRLLRHLRLARLVDLGRVACALHEAEAAVQWARHPSMRADSAQWPDAARWSPPAAVRRPDLRIVGEEEW